MSRKFRLRTFNMSIGQIFSAVKRLILHTYSKVDLMTSQKGLGTLEAGAMTHGEHRPKPPLAVLDLIRIVRKSFLRDFAMAPSQLPTSPRWNRGGGPFLSFSFRVPFWAFLVASFSLYLFIRISLSEFGGDLGRNSSYRF